MKKAIVKADFFFPGTGTKKKYIYICNARHETFACLLEGRPGLHHTAAE